MPKPFAFLQRIFGREGKRRDVIQIFTPQVAAGRSTGTKLVLASATVMGLATAGVIALGALLTLVAAIGAIYFLLTQVLGLELDVDPRLFVQRAQQYAGYSPSN